MFRICFVCIFDAKVNNAEAELYRFARMFPKAYCIWDRLVSVWRQDLFELSIRQYSSLLEAVHTLCNLEMDVVLVVGEIR